MIVGFIGCPCSGKTTVAAKLFAKLKESSIQTEYVPEQARWFIAERRYKERLQPDALIELSVHDQKDIMYRQIYAEKVMSPAVGKGGVLVCDSSALNTLLYLTAEDRKFIDFSIPAEESAKRYDLLFHCPPVNTFQVEPNRIHTREQSLEINRSIPEVLGDLIPSNKMRLLTGSPDERCGQALRFIMESFRLALNP